MSRESLLDEAIAKAKVAEDWQLVEWLRMARGGESAARWYSDKLREAHRTERKLLNENARLRSCLSDDEENARLIMGENVKLRELVRELFDYVCDSEPSCFGCRYHDEDDECELKGRMEKLGVEP